MTADTTQRGTTGMSFTQLFGIGANQHGIAGIEFCGQSADRRRPRNVWPSPSRRSRRRPSRATPSSRHGDNSGVLALQNVDSDAAELRGRRAASRAETASLSDYAAAFYQDVATRGTAATANQTTQDDRLQEAQSRQASTSGVNLDEELTNMTTYQQAYSAGARMLTVVDQLYATLLQIQ